MIRKASPGDIDAIMKIYDVAREFMRNSGNPNQWIDGYPSYDVISNDIEQGNFYVEESDGKICGCFAFITGPEPTYSKIDGRWPDEEPYGTIHRLASSGKKPGVAENCFEFCKSRIPVLRADTHEDNAIMQRLLLRHGFRHCGIIRVANGTPRLAYHYNSTSPE